MAARSHGVDFRNCVRSNFRRELHRLSPPRAEWQVPPISHPPTQDRLTLWLSGMRDNQSTQGSTQVRTVQTGDVPAIPEKHRYMPFRFRGCTRVSLQESDPFTFWQSVSRMEEEEPFSRLTLVCPPLPTLRIKHKCTCLFGIILKYYSQA
jgi:hypothetical protein